MDEQFKRLTRKTFGEVFETMFFTFLEPIDELADADAPVSEDAYIGALIAYHGPQSGSFAVYLPRRLAANITMNFLGVGEEDISDEQMLDTAKETANMAVGSLLGKIDPGGESKLDIPQAMAVEQFPMTEILKEPGIFLFNTDFGLLWVVFKQ